jgi:hypothetical protein
LRRKISISLVFAAAILLLPTTTNPLILFNLQPAQAQSSVTIRTAEPSRGDDTCTSNTAMITFDAQGTPSSSHPQYMDITSGTFRITSIHDGQTLYSGNIHGGRYFNTSGGGGNVGLDAQANDVTNNTSSCISEGEVIRLTTSCSTSDTNSIYVYKGPNEFANFQGAVNCSQGGGDDTTTQSSSSMTGTTTTQQDSDGDGILDANDNCPNLPYTRCYKEGDTALVVHNSNR